VVVVLVPVVVVTLSGKQTCPETLHVPPHIPALFGLPLHSLGGGAQMHVPVDFELDVGLSY
jgi:hypothetical protein